MIKKQMLVALLLLLLIPAVMLGGGFLSSLINPEVAAGHPNYVRNWHLLSPLKTLIILGMFATVVALYLLGSFLVIDPRVSPVPGCSSHFSALSASQSSPHSTTAPHRRQIATPASSAA